ncbi:MAG: SIS domain-containing protein [bacterium]
MSKQRAVGEPMREQIRGQPVALRALLARRGEISARIAAASGEARKPRRVWAVGHGDSYFAPLAAADAFRRWTVVPYTPVLAQEMAAYPPPELEHGALVIAVSMSGGVGRSVAAAQTAKDRGARVLAITNTPNSPLSRVAHETIILNIVEAAPFLAGTVTYTASVLALWMIATHLSDGQTRGDSKTEVLAAAVGSLESALASEAVLREWTAAHVAAPVWYILGMGPQEATARYGAAKLVEVADVVAVAHETEEFFHEHHWVVTPGHPVVILAHDVPSQQRAAAAVAHLTELGIPVVTIGSCETETARNGVLAVPIPAMEPWAAPLAGAVPLQWLAYWLSRARGLNPDLRSHLRASARYVVSRKYR